MLPPQEQTSVNSSSSRVEYRPRTELDYGTLLCLAENRSILEIIVKIIVKIIVVIIKIIVNTVKIIVGTVKIIVVTICLTCFF